MFLFVNEAAFRQNSSLHCCKEGVVFYIGKKKTAPITLSIQQSQRVRRILNIFPTTPILACRVKPVHSSRAGLIRLRAVVLRSSQVSIVGKLVNALHRYNASLAPSWHPNGSTEDSHALTHQWRRLPCKALPPPLRANKVWLLWPKIKIPC